MAGYGKSRNHRSGNSKGSQYPPGSVGSTGSSPRASNKGGFDRIASTGRNKRYPGS